MNKNTGFTLLELIVTISIIAILTTLALPAFNNLIGNSRLSSNVNLLVGSLNYARSEAIDRGVQVRVQPAGNNWEVVLVATGEVLKQFQGAQGNISVTTALANVTYDASGFRAAGAAADKIDVCDTERSVGRRIQISVSGSFKVSEISC